MVAEDMMPPVRLVLHGGPFDGLECHPYRQAAHSTWLGESSPEGFNHTAIDPQLVPSSLEFVAPDVVRVEAPAGAAVYEWIGGDDFLVAEIMDYHQTRCPDCSDLDSDLEDL